MMAKALMIQGTGSGVGKSLICTALCKIMRDMGVKVAPFKAQNMALNSYITLDGGEIGRAQALQAIASQVEPETDMNPILLKASGEMGSQVIIQGKVHSTVKATEYYEMKDKLWKFVKESYERLSQRFELIIIEGAGSPAEINLMDKEIVNMRMAHYAKAPVILLGDIDRGGVFASLYGTVKLLGRRATPIKAFMINKFRGDMSILKPGLDMITRKTQKPVIGVLPYIDDLCLWEEDGLGLKRTSRENLDSQIKIVVLRLRYISNFTDFDPFLYEPDVELIYSNNPDEIRNADILIIPGTKNTVKDLLFLKERRLDKIIYETKKRGKLIIGICGGYQMLGRKILDPHNVESSFKEIDGLGLLDIETVYEKNKITCQVIGDVIKDSHLIKKENRGIRGYEIHMGRSYGDIGVMRLRRLPDNIEVKDGSIKDNVFGTYIHGIFDNDTLRRDIINSIRIKKGLSPIPFTVRYSEIKETEISRVAHMVRENIDMNFIKRCIGR